MDDDLTAILHDWMMVYVGPPASGIVLVGRVAGHERIRDGNFVATSPVVFLARDLSFATTSSQGRRYVLKNRSRCMLAHLAVLVKTLFVSWKLPPLTPVWVDLDPEALLEDGPPAFDA